MDPEMMAINDMAFSDNVVGEGNCGSSYLHESFTVIFSLILSWVSVSTIVSPVVHEVKSNIYWIFRSTFS